MKKIPVVYFPKPGVTVVPDRHHKVWAAWGCPMWTVNGQVKTTK